MDQRVADDFGAITRLEDDQFLLREGLELLANFRSIKDETVRQAIQTLVASVAESGVMARFS